MGDNVGDILLCDVGACWLLTGGFAVVLEVRGTATNERLALKRISVNDEHDLFLCRQEIAIMVSVACVCVCLCANSSVIMCVCLSCRKR